MACAVEAFNSMRIYVLSAKVCSVNAIDKQCLFKQYGGIVTDPSL